MCIKEKHITQAESVQNYKLCDDLLEDIGEIRGKKRELEREKALLEAKDKRAKRRKMTTSSSTSPVPLASPVLDGPNTLAHGLRVVICQIPSQSHCVLIQEEGTCLILSLPCFNPCALCQR